MTDLELQDTVARIKRAQAATDKFVDEGHKLRAEAGKLERDRQLLPWQVAVTLLGAGAALFAAGAAFVKLMGG